VSELHSNVAIVSTSVNHSPEAYEQWAKQGHLIVAGDHNSPPELQEYVKHVGGEYLTPEMQETWLFSSVLGWNCIQRRNAAVMTAYARGFRYVATVDDDNLPINVDWVAQHVAHLEGHVPADTLRISGNIGWVNTGHFAHPSFRQRGTPYGAVHYHGVHDVDDTKLVVSTAHVLGDPDCDAVSRIAYSPHVDGVEANVIVAVSDYAAFNSQATLWNGEWAPLMAVLPGVGRYDDIFASYIAKRIMRARGVTFYAGTPCVFQSRNEHDAASDLRNEIFGMDHTPHVIECLEGITDASIGPSVSLADAYKVCTDELTSWDALPVQTLNFMYTWHKTWTSYEF
jgi:hypothetical protein